MSPLFSEVKLLTLVKGTVLRVHYSIFAALLLGAAGCVTQPAGEVINGTTASAFRDENIMAAEGTARHLSEFPLPVSEETPAYPEDPYFYLDHGLRYDVAWQEGDFRPSNEMGREYGERFSTRLTLRAAWQPYPWLYFGVVPEWYYGDTVKNGDPDRETVFHEALIRLAAGNMWIDFGRFPMWWGPGTHGSLLLSNNYRTRDTLRISNPRPVILPGWLSKLGLCRLTAFVSDLNDGAAQVGRYLGGIRASFKTTPRFEFALSRTFVFPKTDTSVTSAMLWDILFRRAGDGGEDPSDQKAALDLRYTFPGITPVSLYAQLATEDEVGNRPVKLALLAGASAYLPWGRDRLRITVEWADMNLNGYGADWYTPLYYVRGNCIGHHAGTDGTDFYVEVAWLDSTGRERAKFFVDREEHGVSTPVTEILTEKGLEVSLGHVSPWTYHLRFAVQDRQNANGVAGLHEDASLISIAVSREL